MSEDESVDVVVEDEHGKTVWEFTLPRSLIMLLDARAKAMGITHNEMFNLAMKVALERTRQGFLEHAKKERVN